MMRREQVGFNKLTETIGKDFCLQYKDVSCFSTEEVPEGLYCFLGFDLHANERTLTLSSNLDEWDVYATCIVFDDNTVELRECKLPSNIHWIALNPSDQPTKEQATEIEEASRRPIQYTEDAPELTDEELSEFRPVKPHR
ncbi:hypothetical protein [Pseudobutyrivibrio xylanivorans]|uniref:Uncharacterized protein n=1 Tax=Pseudobutyrivibrio xylanivorans TaxID=185007 RepID=A0A5P6VM21_PSEXY|nr:hypothetical protein [Pseudobutyrivibrio xylanivorans]QFJ53408.1 hypothetical protein FXF36_00230 [Pseudobutyrivibrio xylanivorans]